MDSIEVENGVNWENLWAPYDLPTYQSVLEQLRPTDIVLEIGAGDLRLASQMAQITQKVYAIEIQPQLIDAGISAEKYTKNLIPILGDACSLPFPGDITTGVLLMRHCTHFFIYATKLKAIGCTRLITNSRWRLGIESVLLQAERQKFENVDIGWYACWCGSAGFVSGPADQLTPEVVEIVHEVADCPHCREVLRRK